MFRSGPNPALKTATCAALLAATLAAPVHAGAIRSIEKYCASSWRQAGIPMGDWDDCTQDTLLELLSRIQPQDLVSAIEEPDSAQRRELMRSVWCVAQRWRRATAKQPVSLDVLVDQAAPGEDCSGVDKEAVAAAIDDLSPRQRQILNLWLEGNSVAEIASQMEIPAARVSDLKYKAIRSLKSRLQA